MTEPTPTHPEPVDGTDSWRATADVVLHPVRLRILQAVAGQEMTTAQLRTVMPDVAPATLYRHVNALLDADILTVVAQRQVRGAVERTLGLGSRQAHAGPDAVGEVDVAQIRQAFRAFVGSVAGAVEQHLEQESPSELFGFSSTMLQLGPDEIAALQQELAELLDRYRAPGEGRRPVMLSTVVVPSPRPD